MISPVYPDPFNPVLLRSTPQQVSDEQFTFINEAIDIACSDTQFAQKLKAAIKLILTSGPIPNSTLTSLSPSTVLLGSPSFDLIVKGVGFTPESIIIFAGQEEPTTYISPNEVSTGINMPLWVGPDTVDVQVRSGSGMLTNVLEFAFIEAAPLVITSLVPSTVAIGAPDFTLHVHGNGFTPTSEIDLNGTMATTVFVSSTELTAAVDMGLVLAPVVALVTVKDGSNLSNAVPFTVTA